MLHGRVLGMTLGVTDNDNHFVYLICAEVMVSAF